MQRSGTNEAFSRPCVACGAQPGHGCIEDGEEQPMTGMHAVRVFDTAGPLLVRHTGAFDEEGGAILERVNEPKGDA